MLGAVVLVSACSAATIRVESLSSETTSQTAPAAVAPSTAQSSGVTTSPVSESEIPASDPPVSAPSTVPSTPTTSEPDRTWTLLAGGDVLMDRSEAAGIDPFAGIQPALDSADIAVVNVEMAISERGVAADKMFVFRAPPSAADRIAAAGVDVGNLANNHAKDYGPDALVDTANLLESAGVVALGAGATAPDAYRHRVIEVRDSARVAFVGASMVVPWGFAAGASRPGIASAYERDRVLANVRVAASDADVVIAVVRWGIERMTCPDGRQRDFAVQLVAAGADAVIGQHPHVVQPVHFADGKLVAYSLGNFVWHYRSGITGETGVLQIDFDGADIVGWSFHPHVLDANGAPVPADGGARVDRINDIVNGDCARHQPPPLPDPTPKTDTDTDTDGESDAESEAEPEAEAETEAKTEAETADDDSAEQDSD